MTGFLEPFPLTALEFYGLLAVEEQGILHAAEEGEELITPEPW